MDRGVLQRRTALSECVQWVECGYQVASGRNEWKANNYAPLLEGLISDGYGLQSGGRRELPQRQSP